MVRPASVDSNGTKKGAWSEEEDDKLRAYIQRYGHWNWRLLPKYAGLSRCGKSCRLRWVNYLKPGVKRGNFTKQEEDLVIQLHAQLGNKWSAIATKLPGRTDNEVKNFWHTRVENKYRKPHNQSRAAKKTVISSKDNDRELQDEEHTETINDVEPAAFDTTNPFTQPGLADSWPDLFPVDTPYNELNDYNYAPLIMPEEYLYFSEYNYSGSDSSHLSSSAQQLDFWNIDASNASSSQSDQTTYNDVIPSGGVDGVYDPLFDYFDHGINLFN